MKVLLILKMCSVLFSFIIAAGCHSHRVSQAIRPDEISLPEDIVLRRIKKDIWVHTSFFEHETYGRVSGNGLLIVAGDEACLIDLPWTDGQTGALFEWVAQAYGVAIKAVVPTHSHVDCAGGIAEAHRRGATSYALDKTIALMHRDGSEQPNVSFEDQRTIRCGERDVMLTYPGAGHTVDNIVAWVPDDKVLFGGCLVKSLEATGPGNMADANLEHWPTALQRVKDTFHEAETVVPGHGPPGGLELIDHTLKILSK
ncbi:MAG: subclass B1 metallo-beta-lactamase [Myxococcota bacterium]|nr:subclass B1 metallo-beta-lactamase [Myxococcota bacterium]